MPYVVRKTTHKTKPYAIVNANSGRIIGRSTSRTKAQRSASIRNRAHR